jgi:hypothetical protein
MGEWQECPHCMGLGKIPKDTSAFNRLKNHFFKRYNQKAIDVSGSGENEDGKKKYPQFGPKEGRLLKTDIQNIGEKTLEKYMEYFFSDQVMEVKRFTRIKERAGYGYNVFHGMLPKLALYRGKPQKPCEYCASWGAHRVDCQLYTAVQQQFKEEKEELEKIRDENQDIDIKAMFRNARKGVTNE